jgi:MoaA/NifB/PqqE/SkfB family radical SAM enzyme
MSVERWRSLFLEAKNLGISFILLAGGEPLMNPEVIREATKIKDVMFPVFTNGTLFDDENLKIFDQNRNLVPIISIEGELALTDERRGEGIFDIVMDTMETFKSKGMLFGASVTVTKDNVLNVTSRDFFDKLYEKGCRAVIYVEYVPVDEKTDKLAPTDFERKLLEEGQNRLRHHYEDTLLISFPGDEKYSGGCLAAGRGFFHINADGSAEPCPFSPFSDTNLKNLSLRDALKSPLFQKLNETGMLLGEHSGGCLLFEHEDEVKAMIKPKSVNIQVG